MAASTTKKFDNDTVKAQVIKTRDLDSESAKPKLSDEAPKPQSSKPPRHDQTPREEVSPPKARVKPPKTNQSEQQIVLTPFLRFPMSGIPRPEISTFIPSSYSMYYIVHLMDDIIRKNAYFKKQQDAWHPFISRLYFGIVFIIQTLKAEIACGHATTKKKNFYRKFSRDYPPESLPIPGPLVTLFESLYFTKPSNTLEAVVTPAIPSILGPIRADTLIALDANHTSQLLLPNIPGILGFIGTLTTAQANAVPDYSRPATFSNDAVRTLNGSVFAANAWTPAQRSFLLTPGMLYLAETDQTIDTNCNLYGSRLRLPIPAAADTLVSIEGYTYLDTDNEWFGRILPIMECYCGYFKESIPLSKCDFKTTVSPLITTEYYKLSSATAADNNFATLTHAFPEDSVFKLDTKHSSTEKELPPAATALAQTAALNIKVSVPIPHWTDIGNPDITRHGPYWTQKPVKRSSVPDAAYKSTGLTLTKDFALQRPNK